MKLKLEKETNSGERTNPGERNYALRKKFKSGEVIKLNLEKELNPEQ